MKTTLETITPETAKLWLDKNTRNRPICLKHVASLCREIKLGRWCINGETIILNGDSLMDGQHRLTAIVQTGIAIESLVVRDVPSDSFFTINSVSKPRTNSDILSLEGEKNTALMSASLFLIDRYMTGRMKVAVKYTAVDTLELLKKYPGIRRSVSLSGKTRGFIPGSVLVAAHYLFSLLDDEAADLFRNQLILGCSLTEDQPVYVLRNRLILNSLAKAKLRQCYLFAICVKTWNAIRHKKPLLTLRYTEEGVGAELFPVII